MKKKPLVSVIIPNYNHALFLEERLKSVFKQTYQNFEVILLDDCSIDDSVKILSQYIKHPKVSHFVVNETNSGSPFKQWKKGIDLARGEYIWIAESDDYCDNMFLETLLTNIKPSTSVAYTQTYNVDQDGNKLNLNKWACGLDKKKWLSDYSNSGHFEIKNYLRYRNTIPNASAVIFKKQNAQECIPTEMRYCGDWLFWINLLKSGDIVYIAKPLNYFRKHSETTRIDKNFDNEKERYQEYFKIIRYTSHTISRILNIKKYDWILFEWKRKSADFKMTSIFLINMPIDLIIRYIYLLK